MKRLKLLLLLLLLAGSLSAQNRTVTREVENGNVKVTKIVPVWDKKHDLRLSVGSYSLAATLFTDGFSCCGIEPSFPEEILSNVSYTTPQRFWGAYSLSYAYHTRRWFEVGGTLTYAFTTQQRRYMEDDTLIEKMNGHALSAMATFRFNYLYREKVSLYSTVSVGLVGGTGLALPWMDATLFGCTFGKKVFGFAELGVGLGGWGRVGIGYRFDAKKK